MFDNLDTTINLQKQEIENYKDLNDIYCNEIQSLKKDIKKKNKTILGWTIGGITVTAGLLLLLIFK